MKRTILLILVALAVALVVACAAPTAPPPQVVEKTVPVPVPQTVVVQQTVPVPQTVVVQPTAAPKAVSLKVYVVDFEKGKTDTWLMNEVVPAFKKANPNIDVQFLWGTWSTFDTAVAGFFAAGDGPDIVNLGSEYNGLFGDKLAPLNKYLGADAWPDIKNFVPGTLQNASWKGELRGLPIFTAPRFVFCRTDLMKAAGYDKQPTDFAGWTKLAKDLTKIDPKTNALTQQGFYPMDAATMADFQWYQNAIWSLGGSLYKADGVTPNFDSPEAAAALKFNYDIRKAVYSSKNVGALPPITGGTLLDEGGGAVCAWHSGWGAPALGKPVWSKIDIQPFTGDKANFPNSKSVDLAFVDWWAVPAYSKNVDAAVAFLKFVFNKDNNNKYNQTMNLIPARVDAQTGFVQDDPVIKREAELAAQYSFGYAGILEPSKLRDILQTQLGACLTDQQDQPTTLKNIQDQYTKVLKDAGYIK